MASSKYNVLEHKSHFSPWKDKVSPSPIQAEDFYRWTSKSLFQSSYDKQYAHRNLYPQKNTAIPKYGGYIPYQVPQNVHAIRYSEVARTCFDKLGNQPSNGLSSTGNNFSMDRHIDQSKGARSSKYGKTALILPHPGWRHGALISTTKDTYRNPTVRLNPTYDPTPTRQETKKHETWKSGYETNNNAHDRQGWRNDPVLNGARDVTEYRRRFNSYNGLTREVGLQSSRRPFKKEKGGIVD